MKGKMILLVLSLAAIGFLPGCEEKGPAEKTGERIDEGVDKIRESTEDAAEGVGDAAGEIRDSITR